jgi:alpha-L-rhamnosidase
MKPQAPVGLKCEYLANPLGIAAPSPRFAWTPVSSRRGAEQMAYQIIVSPDSGFIVRVVGDYWDSGRVDSPKTSDIAYAGEPLWSGKTYYWRVRWWDDAGYVSPYSESTLFEMGLLQQRDWKAQWISRREPPEFRSKANITLGETSGEFVQSLGIYVRKEFNFQGKVRKARAYVCGLGYYELRLNGRKVGDHVLDPAQTDYRKIALYSVFDVTDRIEDRNAVAVILGNGRHIKSYGYGPPRLILQLHIERENDLIDRVVTDTTWRASGGPLLENGIYSGMTPGSSRPAGMNRASMTPIGRRPLPSREPIWRRKLCPPSGSPSGSGPLRRGALGRASTSSISVRTSPAGCASGSEGHGAGRSASGTRSLSIPTEP